MANYLLKEHPQTAALILSKVKPACAAKVMSQLPSNLRNDLMRRMLSLKPIVEEAMSIIEKTLHEDFMINFARNLGADTYARMADIINKMERGHMEDIAEEPVGDAAEVGRGPEGAAVHLRRRRQSDVRRRAADLRPGADRSHRRSR